MEVTREVVLEAPVEEVWDALTEPEQLEEWFGRRRAELEPGGDGVFRWEDGEEREPWSKRSRRGTAVAYTWDDGHVEIELEEVERRHARGRHRDGEPGWSAVFSLRALAYAYA